MLEYESYTPLATSEHSRSFIDPLTSVRLLSELMRDYPDLDDNQRRYFLDLILIATDRLIQMLDRKCEVAI